MEEREVRREQFTFYRSYYDALADLPDRDFKATVLAVCAYALDQQEPELKGVRSTVFKLIRPVLDSGRRKAENRRGKNKPEQPETTGNKPEQTGKEKEREKERENEEEREIEKETEKEKIPPQVLARGFETIVSRYPPERRGNPQAARKALAGALTTREDLDRALENLELWRQSDQWQTGQYIPYLTNWVSRGCWQTPPPRAALPKGGSGLGRAELEAIRQVLAQPAERG